MIVTGAHGTDHQSLLGKAYRPRLPLHAWCKLPLGFKFVIYTHQLYWLSHTTLWY